MQLPGLKHPVGNIFCIGRNYAEHARELGNTVPTQPLVFLKPTSALSFDAKEIRFSKALGRVDHEVEIVLAVAQAITAKTPVSTDRLPELVAGMAIGIDVTARDLQEQAKKKGQPWVLAKGQPTFAPVGAFVPFQFPTGFEIALNGQVRQKGITTDMIFDVTTLLRFLGSSFGLSPGDLIFTGTPEGVGPLNHGDRISARILGQPSQLELQVCCEAA